MHAVAGEPGLEFLIRGQGNRAYVAGYHAHVRHAADQNRAGAIVKRFEAKAGSGPGHESAVVPPIEAHPGVFLPGLVLNVRGLVEVLVVIDAENSRGRRRIGSRSGGLRGEEARRHARHHHERGQTVEVGHRAAKRESRNLGAVPLDGESDRGVAENAEIVGVVRVLPDVFAVQHEILPEGLLQTGVEFIAKSGRDGIGGASGTSEQRVQNVIGAADAGKHQIFVKGRFQSARIGHAKNGVAGLDVVSDAQARLRLSRGG